MTTPAHSISTSPTPQRAPLVAVDPDSDAGLPESGAPSAVAEDVRPATTHDMVPAESTGSRLTGQLALTILRLALGFEFLWAFLDKTFGLGYSTPSAKAWIHGGSPTKGFLANVAVGPLQGFYHSIAGKPVSDWLFMIGLAGIGTALILSVAVRFASLCGIALLAMMWIAVWPLAKTGAGQPTGSTNPIIDDHIIGIAGLLVLIALTTKAAGFLGRRWEGTTLATRMPFLR